MECAQPPLDSADLSSAIIVLSTMHAVTERAGATDAFKNYLKGRVSPDEQKARHADPKLLALLFVLCGIGGCPSRCVYA